MIPFFPPLPPLHNFSRKSSSLSVFFFLAPLLGPSPTLTPGYTPTAGPPLPSLHPFLFLLVQHLTLPSFDCFVSSQIPPWYPFLRVLLKELVPPPKHNHPPLDIPSLPFAGTALLSGFLFLVFNIYVFSFSFFPPYPTINLVFYGGLVVHIPFSSVPPNLKYPPTLIPSSAFASPFFFPHVHVAHSSPYHRSKLFSISFVYPSPLFFFHSPLHVHHPLYDVPPFAEDTIKHLFLSP